MKKIVALLLVVVLTLGIFAGCVTNKAGDSYTFNDSTSGSPKTWNPHTWETNEDSYILGFTTMGLYDLILNETKDGYMFVPEMAQGDPVDVTSEYIGKYNLSADASKQAFKISLNKNAVWENGEKINADTYLYSMQELLNPKMQNRRADSYYSGTLEIANAKKYFKQGVSYSDACDETGVILPNLTDNDLYIDVANKCLFFGGPALSYYNDANYTSYFTVNGKDLFAEQLNGKGKVKLTAELKEYLIAVGAAFGDNVAANFAQWCVYKAELPPVDFSEVGIIKTGEYEIVLVLARSITDFYLKYNLSTNFIVNKDLYEKSKKPVGDLISTEYATTLDTTISYGPYKLTTYQADKQITMEKNDKWYGYTDGKHKGQFQTTKLNTQVVPKQATQMQMFEKGELDTISLDEADMVKYRASDYILYTPQDYTDKYVFNADIKKLKERETPGINKSILSYKDFRHAFSLSIDRKDFATKNSSSHLPGYLLLNNMYVADPETGITYRSTDAAKEVLVKLNGIEYGAGKELKTLDEAYDFVTNYDVAQAAKLFQKAYDQAIKDGNIKPSDKVELQCSTYNMDEGYTKRVVYLQDAVNKATVGTSLEGKITLKAVADADYASTMKAGNTDIVRGTWGGAAMDPYSIMDVYLDPTLKYEYAYTGSELITLTVLGKEYTMSCYDWNDCIKGAEGAKQNFAQIDVMERVKILAAMEYSFLSQYHSTPVMYRNTATLDSKKVIQGTDTFVLNVGFGGVRFMTFKYNDAEWADFISDPNNLKYA